MKGDMLFYRDNRIWNLCVPVMMQDTRNFNYVVTTEGHVGYLIPYDPEWDERKGPEIVGNNPMNASAIDELNLNEKDFVFQAGRRLRVGDYCCSKNSGLLEKAQTLLGKVKGGREVNIPEALTAKSGRLCTEPVSFQVKSTSLKKTYRLFRLQMVELVLTSFIRMMSDSFLISNQLQTH